MLAGLIFLVKVFSQFVLLSSRKGLSLNIKFIKQVHSFHLLTSLNNSRMKIPSWNPVEITHTSIVYSWHIPSILKYRQSFIFGNRSKEIDLFRRKMGGNI